MLLFRQHVAGVCAGSLPKKQHVPIFRVSEQADASRPGLDATWGEVNTLDVAHPFAGLPVIGPVLGRWLRLPAAPLPGAPVTLRVATPTYGALLRMSVSPAHPEDGILELAGGQSGHFLSANFADQQQDWVEGKATPFLAGPTVSRILLEPGRQGGR